MNLVNARPVLSPNELVVEVGGYRLPVPAEVVTSRPRLRSFVDRTVALGLRPEDMEDASLVSDAPRDRRIAVEVELREALGSDVLVHFRVAAPPPTTEDAKELASDAGQEALERITQQATGGESTFVARLNPRTHAARGERLELVVDTHRLHFFDPADGSGIYGERVA